MGKLRPSLKRPRLQIETCQETGRFFKTRKSGQRRYCCYHGRRPDHCNEGDCIKNKSKTNKACRKCPCGSDLNLNACRNCDTPGAGSIYCPTTSKTKPRCPCGARTCGGSLCKHLKHWGQCKKCTPIDYIFHVVCCRMRYACGGDKRKSSIQYLCMNAPDFRVYIESTFQPGMTWENQGSEWQIGHRIPIKYKNPTLADIEERLHYSNTFAQWNADNAHQSNQYVWTKY